MSLRILDRGRSWFAAGRLRSLLKSEPSIEVVGEAPDGLQTLSLVASLRPDVALVDISMPGLSGIEVTQQLKRDFPATRVLIVTMHEDAGLLQEALRAGADGYLVKRAAEADLIRAIQMVARGERYIHADLRSSLEEVSLSATPGRPAGGTSS